jgi:3'(2'),5'-bisphosphate nucleotidase
MNLAHYLAELLPVSVAAGAAIMKIYDGDIAVRSKADSSPVTDADEAAEAIILAALEELTPAIPIIAEERASKGQIPKIGTQFWLVDPLDGTREFINRNGEFTVNIALIDQGQPVLGIIFVPARAQLFYGTRDGAAFECSVDLGQSRIGPARPIGVRSQPANGLTVVASRSHRDAATDALIEKLAVADFKAAGSSLKFCLVAAGQADYYPRTGPTAEWDVAAGHAILLAAGGRMTMLDGSPFTYGKANFLNPGFIAQGG